MIHSAYRLLSVVVGVRAFARGPVAPFRWLVRRFAHKTLAGWLR